MMKKNIFYLTLLFLITSFVIFFQFNLIPKNLADDEIDFAKLAQSLDNKEYLPYSTLATGHSTLYFYIILFSFKLFGYSNFALRFPSAVFGILSVLIFYFLIKEFVFEKKYIIFFSFLSSFILATSRWFMNFARFSFEATFLVFLELSSLYFIIKFLKNKKNLYLLASGIFAGFSFLSYTTGRIFFLIPLLILFFNKISWKKYIVFFISFIIIALPLISHFLFNPDLRISEVSIMSQKVPFSSKLISIADNLKKNLLMFNFTGDMNGRHNFPGKPALNPILGILFILGLIISIKDIRRPQNQLMILYFVISIIPTVFTKSTDNPNMLRTFTVLPSVSYFVILSIIFLTKLNINIKRIYFMWFLSFVILLSSVFEIRTYFMYQSRVFKNSFGIKCNLQQIKKLKTNIIPKSCRVQKNEF